MKSSKGTKKLAFLFAVILLLQEFSSAGYVNRPLRLKLENDKKTTEKRGMLIDSEDISEENGLETEDSRSRRSVAAVARVLFYGSVLVTTASIAFEIYQIIEGCCGTYPDACTYEEKFTEAKEALETMQEEINAQWVLAEKKYNWVSYSNNKNIEIWTQVSRIMELSETVVNVLDPDLVDLLSTKNAEIKASVEAGNDTVLEWSLSQFTTEYVSYFESTEGALLLTAGLFGAFTEIMLVKAWTWYQTNEIKKTLTTEYGTQLKNANAKSLKKLGALDVDVLVSDTAKARFDYDTGTTNGYKLMNIVSGIVSLLQIGMDVYISIIKILECKKVRNKIRKAYNNIGPEEANMEAVAADVDEYYTNMTLLYDEVRSKVTSEEFLDYLAQMKNMTDDSGYTNASIAIEEFMDGIEEADESTTYDLQTNLVTALIDVEFVYDCLLRKVRAFANSAADCKAGVNTLENIYTDVVTSLGTNGGECMTQTKINYTTLEDVQAFVATSAERNGYQYDCILNSEDKQSAACGYQCDGYTASETAGLMSLSESQVEYFYSQCSGECPLSPDQIEEICRMHGIGLSNTTIAYVVDLPVEQVDTVLEDCD